MVVATMTNKSNGNETLLIDKADLDELKLSLNAAQAALQDAKTEIIGLNVKLTLMATDLRCAEERNEVFENNILCRTIFWLDVRIKRLASYLRKRFNAWVERKWGTDYE